MVIEIGVTVLAVGILVYMFVFGPGVGSLAMIVAGGLITLAGFVMGRRDQDR